MNNFLTSAKGLAMKEFSEIIGFNFSLKPKKKEKGKFVKRQKKDSLLDHSQNKVKKELIENMMIRSKEIIEEKL